MIPAFDARGLLPDGVHAVSEPDFRSRFADSVVRGQIMDGFTCLRREAESFGLAGLQWVDGSFVTAKAQPGDLDVVTFCDYDLLNQLGPPIQPFYARALSSGKECILAYGCDSYAVPCCDSTHPYFPVFERMRKYWRKHFAAVYDPLTGQTVAEDKGFVSLSMGDESLVRSVGTHR
jgi:hypothetical protein